ncbi:solute symporter family protein [Streptomyces sp. enrichment culture]|uniref:solute symporter family protein n=1 Tax=Streptomyces sp. enrichment culture TaxID=1795815 RepID=UPI003F565253
MSLEILTSETLDSIGSAARRPVIIAFLLFVSCSLLWLFALVADHQDDPDRLYVADRRLPPVLNGFAVAGEQISAVALLAIPGGIALFGYDGFTVAVDILLTLGVMLLLAQKIRDTGRYTMGDLFGLRASGSAPRIAAAVVTLVITLPLLTVQLRAAGINVSLLIGISTDAAQLICMIWIGSLVAFFATVGDLRGMTFMQVVKVPVTLVALAVLTVLALGRFEWNPGHLLTAAVNRSMAPGEYLSPGLWPYWTGLGPLDFAGHHLVVILGAAVTPHLLLRIGASRSGQAARRSISIASLLVGVFVVLLIAAGFASAALLGSKRIGAADGNGQSSLLLLAHGVVDGGTPGGVVLVTVIACVTFLAVITAVTSVTFAAAASLTRDVFARHLRRPSDAGEIRLLRLVAVLLCALGLSLSVATRHYQVEFLFNFAMNVAASCVFPVLIYSLFWPRFNRRGVLWSVYSGLTLCTLLATFSPEVSGTAYALWPEAHFAWYPLQTPGLISVPAAFLLGWVGSVTSKEVPRHDFPDIEYRVLTGSDPRTKAVGPHRG